MLLREGIAPIVLSIALGPADAAGLAGYLSEVLFDLTPLDPDFRDNSDPLHRSSPPRFISPGGAATLGRSAMWSFPGFRGGLFSVVFVPLQTALG